MLDFIMVCYTAYIVGAFLRRKRDLNVFDAERGFYIFIGAFFVTLRFF